jgi:uracil-DNA glycosylase
MVSQPGSDTIQYDKIVTFLKEQKDNKVTYFPEGKDVYKAFRATPLEKVRIVIVGQDPYPKAGYANGMAFATDNAQTPVSLQVMFDGIEDDAKNGLDFDKPLRQNNLLNWSDQGILLLNTALTVEADKPASHAEIWKPFTEFLIENLTAVKRDLIWIGLGAPARKFLEKVNVFRNFVYLAEHPAAAAREKRKWNHNNVFTKANLAIKMNNLGEPIKW